MRVALQQQSLIATVGHPDDGDNLDPWQYWTAATIAAVAHVPVAAVEAIWPLQMKSLADFAIADRKVQAAAIGTIAIETASTFLPVREAFWLTEQWRAANLRYYPFYGRGLIQLTWQSNYQAEGDAIGVDLVNEPDRALDPWIAADALARFFDVHGVADAAMAEDWSEVRRRVQGGWDSLPRLEAIATTLLAMPIP